MEVGKTEQNKTEIVICKELIHLVLDIVKIKVEEFISLAS